MTFTLLAVPTTCDATQSSHASSPCNPITAALAGATDVDQLMTVIAPSTQSRTATFWFYARSGNCFRQVYGPYTALVGANGLSTNHFEGDDTAPIGRFNIRSTMYGVAPNPGVEYHYHRLVCGDWWDEQSLSPLYNHFVHVGCDATPPSGADSEALWRIVP